MQIKIFVLFLSDVKKIVKIKITIFIGLSLICRNSSLNPIEFII